MQNSTNLEVVITAKDEASAKLKSFSNQMSSMKGTFATAAAAGTAAFAAITAGIVSSISAAAEAEAGEAQLAAVLKSTGGAAGVTSEMALNLASSLSQVSTYTDDAILSAENMLLTFTHIGKDIFPEATQTVLDMSVALGQDLKSSSIQLGKALNDPITGITALRRVGVSFTESQQQMIETLVNTGRGLEAQKIILKELATEFGGSALAKAQSFSGVMTILKNNIGETQEAIGRAFLPMVKKIGIEVNDVIVSITKWVNEHPNLVRGILTAAGVITGLIAALGALGVAFVAASAAATVLGTTVYAMLGPIGWVVGAISLLGVGAGVAAYKMGQQKTAAGDLSNASTELNKNMKDLSAGIEGSGKKADETAKKLKALKEQMAEIVAEGAKQEANSRKSMAELFVDQEQKVADITSEIDSKNIELKKARRDQDSSDRINSINEEISALQQKLIKESEALIASQNFKNQLDVEYTEAKRRASLTEFQRKLEDIVAEQKANREATTKKIKAKQEEIDELIKEEKRYTATVLAENQKQIDSYGKVAAARANTLNISGFTSSLTNSQSTQAIVGRFAQGGNAQGGSTYLVGENGPELFTPNRNGVVVPNLGQNSKSIVVNINGGTYLSRDVALEIGDVIIDSLKQTSRI